MKIESKPEEKQILQNREIDFSCSKLNTTIHFPDFEVSLTEKTLTNSDRHLKKHEQQVELKVRKKELLREQIRVEIEFLKNKLALFSLQTDKQLDESLQHVHSWMDSVGSRLKEDEIVENELLALELEKSFSGKTANLDVLDKTDSLIDSSKIYESFSQNN